jgi:hypothetical protein
MNRASFLVFLATLGLHANVALQYYPQENPCVVLAGVANFQLFCASQPNPWFGLLILGGTTSPGAQQR